MTRYHAVNMSKMSGGCLGIESADLENKSIGLQVKFEFHKNNEYVWHKCTPYNIWHR